jgi:hypothetical protein
MAYYPWADQSNLKPNDPKITCGTDSNQWMKIEYTVSTNSGEHIDLMYSREGLISGLATNYAPVALDFRHALTRLMFAGRIEGFSTGTNVKITAIKIRNAIVKGELMVLDPDLQPGKAWWTLSANPADKKDITMPLTHVNGVQLISVLQPVMKSILMSGGGDTENGDMLVLPQSIKGILLEIGIEVDTLPYTYIYELDEMPDWVMNEVVIYEITVRPDRLELR